MKLSAYQQQIYQNNNKLLELRARNLVLKAEAEKISGAKDKNKIKQLADEISKNSLEAAALSSGNFELTNALEARRSDLVKKIKEINFQSPTDTSSKELADAKEEIRLYNELQEIQIKKQQQEQIYKTEKLKLYNIIGAFTKDPASLNNILVPFAQKKKTKGSVGVRDIVSSGLSAFGFALKNISSVKDFANSYPFYQEEAAKIRMGKGKEEETSFFLKLLDDPDTIKFLEANSAQLGNLLETIAPTLLSITIRELSKLPELQNKLKDDEKKHGSLENLENKLKDLQAKTYLNETDNKEITKLTEQINDRKLLAQRVGIAKTFEALEKAGITTEYIQKKLLPIAINPLKELLKNPNDAMDIANASLDIILQNDSKKTSESLQFIASKIDIPKLINSSGVQDFLVQESANLSKIATIVMTNNESIKAQADKFGITPEIVQDVMPMATKAVATILGNSKEVITIATESQKLLSSLDKSTQGLKAEQTTSLSAVIGSLDKIMNQPGISDTLSKDLPQFLEKNKENIPDIVSKLVQNTPALANAAAKMGVPDVLIRDAAKLGAELAIGAAPLIDQFARATLKEQDQLITIISDVRDLANTPKENQKEAVLKVVTNIVALKESNADLKNIFDKELPSLLEKNQEQLAKVIDGIIQTKVGPELQLKTEKIIKVVAKNLPTVIKVADLYSKGKYAAMFPQIVKLAFKKDVLSTAIGTLYRIKKYKAEKKKENLEHIIEETIRNDLDSSSITSGIQVEDNKKLQQIKSSMNKHIDSSARRSSVISKNKSSNTKSEIKINK